MVVLVVVSVTTLGRRARDLDTLGVGAGLDSSLHQVGGTGRSGELEFTVLGFAAPYPPPSESTGPEDGDEYVGVDVRVRNGGTIAEDFPSRLGFRLRDGSGHQYQEVHLPEVNPGPPDGVIPPGSGRTGFVVFQVPNGATHFQLRCQATPADPVTVFVLS